jgi:hypothetical protein
MKRDPTGLYEVDVHQFLTRFLAEAAGFDPTTAEKIGFQTQQLDRDTRDAMYGGANKKNMQMYHFVTPARLTALRQTAFATLGTDGWMAVGEYLHALEDTYSHQKNETRRDWSTMYGTDIGHGAHGHEPDQTWRRPELATLMAVQVWSELQALAEASGAKGTPKSWDDIKGNIDSFVRFKPELYTQQVFKTVPVENVRDYQEKIHLLNPTYTLDTWYRVHNEDQDNWIRDNPVSIWSFDLMSGIEQGLNKIFGGGK